MLRAFFIALSESKSLRGVAERSAIGQRMSGRFVAGTQVEDALRATEAINQHGRRRVRRQPGRERHQRRGSAGRAPRFIIACWTRLQSASLNANVSLKLTHMGLDVDENLGL